MRSGGLTLGKPGRRLGKARRHWWANGWTWTYALIALTMGAAALVFKLHWSSSCACSSPLVDTHSTFLLEAIVIALIAVFWMVQTVDRWDERAPQY
jgi:hypothetical protein